MTFSVGVTNGVALANGDYVWECQYSSDIATLAAGQGQGAIIGKAGVNEATIGVRGPDGAIDPDGIHADEDGTPATFTFEIPLGADINLIRLSATPIAEW